MSLKLLRLVRWGRSKWFEATIEHNGTRVWSRDPARALEHARGADAAYRLRVRIAERRGRDPNAPRVVGASVSAQEFDTCVGSALEAEIFPLRYTRARRRVW
ncbi:hypothetical protein [Jannaschia aquimarina]|uniref:hypothetical protein n=1 Tax=Jannaschia aquimarina TaxID=935700 RepID=UPI0005C4F0B8|nr:hypothetical protein [Jannaschia aquimarina]